MLNDKNKLQIQFNVICLISLDFSIDQIHADFKIIMQCEQISITSIVCGSCGGIQLQIAVMQLLIALTP